MAGLRLFMVIPCYNEEEVIQETNRRLHEKIHKLIQDNAISDESRIVYVNDGSSDGTWEIIKHLHGESRFVLGLCLSRNRGHQNALLAGLHQVRNLCDIAISMDADLQDDIDAIELMIDEYRKGYDIVYGVRSSRKKDSFFKKSTAHLFYKMMRGLGAEVIYNHADFRLMSSRALLALYEFKEYNVFLRGMIPMIGYDSQIVYYERKERFAGKSKYPLRKMMSFAFEGITSLSIRPIRMITIFGVLVFAMSIVMMIYTFSRFFAGETVSGWSSLIISIWAIGGLQLFGIGVIGEYIGKVYLETKARPKYIIKEFLDDNIGMEDKK